MARCLVSILVWLSLATWFTAVVSAGVSAMGIFATLPGLEPILPTYSMLSPEAQGRIAAGLVTEPIFTATDLVQCAASIALVAGVILHWLLSRRVHRRIARWTWTLAIAVATCTLWGRVLFLMPEMNQQLHDYRQAASSGNMDVADTARLAFESMHPTASMLMEATAACLLLALLVGAAAAGLESIKGGEPS